MKSSDMSAGRTQIIQPGSQTYHEPYLSSINSMAKGMETIQHDPNLLQMHELDHEMKTINNCFDHMKMDEEFINASPNWKNRFRERQLVTERQAVINTADKFHRDQFVPRYSHNMNQDNLMALEANQFRENEEWAKEELRGLKNEIMPIAEESHKRINQFCDWVGVTDRYRSYRQNLAAHQLGEKLPPNKVYFPGTPLEFQKYHPNCDPMRNNDPQRFNLPSEVANAMLIRNLQPGLGEPSWGKKFYRDDNTLQKERERKNPPRCRSTDPQDDFLTEYKDKYVAGYLERIRDVNSGPRDLETHRFKHLSQYPVPWEGCDHSKLETIYGSTYTNPNRTSNRVGPWDPPKPFGL